MANKRQFKKYITTLSSAVCNDMMVAYYNVEGIDREAVENSVKKVIKATEFAVHNSNIFFDKGRKAFDDPKAYSAAKHSFFNALFYKLREDYVKAIDEALKDFNAAVPADVKAANKDVSE